MKRAAARQQNDTAKPRTARRKSGEATSANAEREGGEGQDRPLRRKRARALRQTPPQTGHVPGALTEPSAPAASRLRFEWVAIPALRPYERALAKPNPGQHLRLMSSIRQFGFVLPIVATADGLIIVGEKRFAAAKEAGLERVPVIYAEHLSPAQIRQYRIADNKLGSLRQWDPEALRLELQEIVLLEPDEINIEAMGFDFAEFDTALCVVSDEADAADAILPPLQKAVSRLGDIWEVDGHEIHSGSATSKAAIAAMLRGARPRVVFADGPWNVPYKGHMGGKGRIQHPEFVEGRGEKSEPEFLTFQTSWMTLIREGLVEGGLLYAAIDWRGLFTTLQAARAAGFELINFLVWSKLPGAGLGSFYRSAHELILVLRAPGAPHINRVMLGANGRTRANVLTYPGAASFGSGREALHLHATAKPIALVGDLLLDSSARGELVIDPFSGSGTTLIAAQKTGRRARVMDLDPRYVDVAVRRYEQVFGRAPRLRGTRQTIHELEAERASQSGRQSGRTRGSRRPA
jgi:hypothetical protein